MQHFHHCHIAFLLREIVYYRIRIIFRVRTVEPAFN